MFQCFVEYIETVSEPRRSWAGGSDVGVDQHAVGRVVSEAQVDRAPRDGGLAADRVAVDVERVRLVLDVLEAGEEHRVEGGGRHWPDAAAEVWDFKMPSEMT